MDKEYLIIITPEQHRETESIRVILDTVVLFILIYFAINSIQLSTV